MSKQSQRNKQAKNGQTKIVNTVEWEYELVSQDINVPHWIPEDDERSASYKAKSENGTGNIRSRNVTITTTIFNKSKNKEEVTKTDWEVKEQNLV